MQLLFGIPVLPSRVIDGKLKLEKLDVVTVKDHYGVASVLGFILRDTYSSSCEGWFFTALL